MPEQLVDNLIKKLKVNKNVIALDIGANHGVYSLPLTRKFALVYAIEPHPDNLQVLSTIQLDNLIVVPCAATSPHGLGVKIKLYPSSNPGGHSCEPKVGNETRWGHDANKSFDVNVVSIDLLKQINQKPIGFIKIDVEGYEESVLHGGEHALNDKMIIALETHQTINCQSIYNYMTGKGYEFFDISGNRQGQIAMDSHYLVHNLGSSYNDWIE